VGDDFQVNTYTIGEQNLPTLAMDPIGRYVISWVDFDKDRSLSGVFAQRFSLPQDDDSDGVSDPLEDGAPNGGDGNDDGTHDSEQVNVTSLPNAVDGQYMTLASPAGTMLVDVQSIDPATLPAPPATAGDFPIGVLSFKVAGVTPGGSVDVELLLPSGLVLSSYYKFGSETGTPADHWYESSTMAPPARCSRQTS
jgi:hypothetical protein